MMAGHVHRCFKSFLKSLFYARIRSYSSLKHNGSENFFSLTHVVEIISHQGFTKTVYYLFNAVTHLLFMDHIRLGFEGVNPEIFNGNSESCRLMIKKRAGAGGAHSVHGKINHYTVSQKNYFGILATDL